MKKIFVVLIITIMCFNPLAKADEGMWLPLFVERLNYVDMEKMGLQLSPEEIYSINNSCLKDAIVIFGRGCTAEIISDQGLLLTNHHCGYGRIQAHSSIEHDYLTDGFWAMNKDEELQNIGLYVKFLISIEDVSEQVLVEVNNEMSETERRKKIKEITEKIEEEAIKDNDYEASVKSFYNGNEYYLFVYETFKDIRLVGAPPSSIGKFGADTDNWMWPRHTGDFSLFRVYTDKDGNPAEYSEDNIPLKPKYHLPISINGVKKDDFAMILGYPGGTERYLTSYGVDLAIELSNPYFVKIRQRKLDIMKEDMNASDEIRIKYASKHARTSNYWKYYIGQTKGLKRLKVSDKKKHLENEFIDWYDSDKSLQIKYGKALTDISNAYKLIEEYELSEIYFTEAIRRGSEILGFASKFSDLKKELLKKEADKTQIDKTIESLKEQTEKYFKDYNAPTDKKILAAMFEMYYKNVPLNQQPEYLKSIAKKYKSNFKKFATDVFNKSIFASEEKVENFLNNPSAKAIEKDIAYKTIKAFMNNFYQNIKPKTIEAYELLNKGNRIFIAGLREMQPEKKFYPDANFTMRLSYGKVLDYFPANAVHYDYKTTLKGVMEKEDPDNWEFIVPDKLKELYKNKDYGQYGEGKVMKVCFLTDHDITGGNSGSPVINGKGELIGLAFDGNWEAMSGDIAFEPELQRTINVDVRYVLFIIDKFAGAKNLIDEMTIVSKKTDISKDLREKEMMETQDVEK
ncbi:MAG: S46 family peptidase [Bacteroidales bacterium]|nr:S46 family peptidase [Bacteroidales bacterium]